VIGQSFRMVGPGQNVYTMAATAAYRLIQNYDIDPERVGFLGLGTESSTDNSAGSIIIKGMLDDTLQSQGEKGLSRYCQVPEFKHACLGGIYAMKDALRWLSMNEDDQVGIVIAADIATYKLGSSGESTQGAGAVAILLERNPTLLEVDIKRVGSASTYRGVDFRKPRYRTGINGDARMALPETPIFNGQYSVSCYLEQTLSALRDMLRKLDATGVDYYRGLAAVFLHRPYQRMPVNSWALSYLVGLSSNGAAGRAELSEYCSNAHLETQDVIDEMRGAGELLTASAMENVDAKPFDLCMQLLRDFRSHNTYEEQVSCKIRLGTQLMRDIGNIYAGALPAWIAAGLEQAYRDQLDLAGQSVLALGYGSGDAAEALPMKVAENWQEAAARIGFSDALDPHQDLESDQYYALHETGTTSNLDWFGEEAFMIDRVGCRTTAPVANDGIEYYRFNHPAE
jgi:hydroxymethylglutaryl-CoA synthase